MTKTEETSMETCCSGTASSTETGGGNSQEPDPDRLKLEFLEAAPELSRQIEGVVAKDRKSKGDIGLGTGSAVKRITLEPREPGARGRSVINIFIWNHVSAKDIKLIEKKIEKGEFDNCLEPRKPGMPGFKPLLHVSSDADDLDRYKDKWPEDKNSLPKAQP